MSRDPETIAHAEWLGYVQPVGLVVSIPALLAAQAHLNRHILPKHQQFVALLPRDRDGLPQPLLPDFPAFTREVLGWRDGDLEPVAPGTPAWSTLEVPLPEYHETLRPTHVVREHAPRDPAHPWLMLVQVLPPGTPLDEVASVESRQWQATPHAKFERLLRETQVPAGLLVNGAAVRLVYAPRGETSGYLTFSVAEMAQVAGRPLFAALHMLLCEDRLFTLAEKQRLPAILADSRKYQNHVSTELAQQVLSALYELLRGFQSAHAASRHELLREVLAHDPAHVYHGLLTVLMRLVFVLYAEDRGLVSSDPVYANYYSVTGLFERLRADAGRFPDTLDQRFGAWAQLLTLFRLIYDGGSHGDLAIPPRRGYLFDPDRYNFLEGRSWQTPRHLAETPVAVPRVSDGVVFRVLQNLLVLDGERLSYRSLDVEQIGSVYETMMGFGIEVAEGRSIAIKPKKKHGAPTTINLDALLGVKPAERNKWLKAQADRELTGKGAAALKEAADVDQLLVALDSQLARNVTPNVVPAGAMVFQPSDERRRSGSHYTPRSLTEPIVRTTLRPVLEQLGPQPTPQQILGLKVCDPAMGSGAFLVEVCRQLGDQLVQAWRVHRCLPALPPDEDELLHARRLVAQRCLYGVDKNPMAVDLSKLSLWLATLAKDHPFTFLDHSLRCGDSLVGLTRQQIAAFHWQPTEYTHVLEQELGRQIERATEARRKIIAAPEETPYTDQQQAMGVAEEALDRVRRIGDLAIAAFFAADKPKEREQRRK
ncbi:MAG: N-6 DNA methylase [Planctomycetaceae bacterium]